MADRCRYLAASCITEAAKRPLNEMAEQLEQAADEEQPVVVPTTFGRC
jgi:hypothetical protein